MNHTLFTDTTLLYAATARCNCGAGLAYPLDSRSAVQMGAWVCSRVLRGEVPLDEESRHDRLPFALYKVREETSINNESGATTRPAGSMARTVGRATCPKCQHAWESEPYSACGLGHHWFSGPCPQCAYSNGGDGTGRWATGEVPPIEPRYRDVVVSA
jgi:hypothetical protein